MQSPKSVPSLGSILNEVGTENFRGTKKYVERNWALIIATRSFFILPSQCLSIFRWRHWGSGREHKQGHRAGESWGHCCPKVTFSPWQQTRYLQLGQRMDGRHSEICQLFPKLLGETLRGSEDIWDSWTLLTTRILVSPLPSVPLYHQPLMPTWCTWVWEGARPWRATLALQPSTHLLPAACQTL